MFFVHAQDANILERVLMAKARDLGIMTGHQQLLLRKKRPGGISLGQKIKTLYDTLKDYRDAKARPRGGGEDNRGEDNRGEDNRGG